MSKSLRQPSETLYDVTNEHGVELTFERIQSERGRVTHLTHGGLPYGKAMCGTFLTDENAHPTGPLCSRCERIAKS